MSEPGEVSRHWRLYLQDMIDFAERAVSCSYEPVPDGDEVYFVPQAACG